MSEEIELSIAYNAYDRSAPIADGRVRPAGINPAVSICSLAELFAAMVTDPPYDVSELSLSSYAIARAHGDDRLIAIPIFLSRAFRSNSIYVRDDGSITGPRELAGRRVGVPMYQQTAGVWARGFLRDEYELDLDSITWVRGELGNLQGDERRKITVPSRVTLDAVAEGRLLEDALRAGEVDAIISPTVPPSFRAADGGIARMFPGFPNVDRDYYARTGLFPIMHTVVVKREVYEANPWVATSLFEAFTEAKDLATRDQANVSYIQPAIPFVAGLLDEQLEIFGDDPWPYGFEQNRAALDAFMRYMIEQGLLPEGCTAEQLFAPETLSLKG